MSTFKPVILPTQKRSDGSYNVKIRLTHNRKSKYIKTPYYVMGKDIVKKKKDGKEEIKIKNQAILDKVEEIIVEYKKALLPLGMKIADWDVNMLAEHLTASPDTFTLNFIKYGFEHGDKLISKGKISTGKSYHIAMRSLIRFVGRDSLDISEITVKFLQSYENFLREEPVHKGKRGGDAVPTQAKKKGRALSLYLSKMKTLHDAAKREYNDDERGVINIPYSPFVRFTIPSVGLSEHRVLTIEQIQSIIDLPYRKKVKRGLSEYNTAKDLFVMSFALMGINTADLFDSDTINGDILEYNRKKTRTRRKDGALMKVRIEPEIMGLVAKYRGKNKAFMFSEHYSTSVNMNKIINQGLKRIGKDIGVPNLNYYYARHSMASLCANKLGIDIARVDEMLNHSDPKLALARVYIEKDYKPLWEANRKLLDLFDWSFYTKKAEE